MGMGWQQARDEQVKLYWDSLDDESYDALLRDVWLLNNQKADIALYMHSNYEFKVFGVYAFEDDTNEELIGSLHDISVFLSEEGFRSHVATKRTDNIRYDSGIELDGNYALANDIDESAIDHLEQVISRPLKDLDPLTVKDKNL